MKDIMDKPFGGKVIILGGDFRQILPVIPRAGRAKIVMTTLNSSRLRKHCKVLTLSESMGLQGCGSALTEREIKEFVEWIAALGDSDLGTYGDGEIDIEIPDDLLTNSTGNIIGGIISFAYPNLLSNFKNIDFFKIKQFLLLH